MDYVARRCLRVPIGARVTSRGAGALLHVRAGIIGVDLVRARVGPPALPLPLDRLDVIGLGHLTMLMAAAAKSVSNWARAGPCLDRDRRRPHLPVPHTANSQDRNVVLGRRVGDEARHDPLTGRGGMLGDDGGAHSIEPSLD